MVLWNRSQLRGTNPNLFFCYLTNRGLDESEETANLSLNLKREAFTNVEFIELVNFRASNF